MEVNLGAEPRHVAVSRSASSRLRGVVGPLQFFALSVACVIGSGWVVILGEWLRAAGPGGTVLGFVAGGLVMLATTGAYAELVARFPVVGGEFVYAQRAFGDRAAFIVGWLLTLSLLAVVTFEATALAWILETIFQWGPSVPLYKSLGQSVTMRSLEIGIGGALLVGILNYLGIQGIARVQTLLSLSFLVLAIVLIVSGGLFGDIHHLNPLFDNVATRPWWQGAVWIFATAPMFLTGFQSAAQVIEECSVKVTPRRIARAMALAVIFSALFYCMITIAASMAMPWKLLVPKPLATAAAFKTLPLGGPLMLVVLGAAALAIVRIWIGASLWAARLLFAQGRAGVLPSLLARTSNRFGSPIMAVLVVAVCTALGSLLGKGALVPLVNTASICLAGSLVIACACALRCRAVDVVAAPYKTPGGSLTIWVGLCGSFGMFLFSMLDPLLRRSDTVPLEWLLLVLWMLAGVFFMWRSSRGPGAGADEFGFARRPSQFD